MIATIAVIAAIAEKKKFSDHMETTLQPSQRQLSPAIVVAAIAGECLWFHTDRWDRFFSLSDRSDHMETGI